MYLGSSAIFSGDLTSIAICYRWLIEIDGLANNSMVDLSMAMLNNQMIIR